MAHNQYDVAFQEYLRTKCIPHILVDERRRAQLQQMSLKSMDFIVTATDGQNLLIDVKGRHFPTGSTKKGHKWENWATLDDIESLLQWEQVFGDGFSAMLVFAYELRHSRYEAEFEEIFAFRNRQYAFYGVWVQEYQETMRTRSQSWSTVSISSGDFRQIRRPVCNLIS